MAPANRWYPSVKNSMAEASKSAPCRQKKSDWRCSKVVERDPRSKEKALAEAAALLVPS